jgi:lipopolysaccharide biosynthesis glycosyltransferase
MRWPRFLRKAAPQPRQQFPNVVFFAADARYLQLAWLAASTAAAEPNRNFDVALLVLQGEGPANLPAPPGCRMIEITLPDWLQRWPVPAHMSTASYARLFAADFWLASWDRALYLDSDVLIEGPLAPLFRLNLGGRLAALVEDCGFCRRDEEAAPARVQTLRQIGLDPTLVYFNAGVMLFDTAAWRALRVAQHLPAFKEVEHKLSGSVDQDFVNWVLGGAALQLSPRWNFQTHYLGLDLEPCIAPVITHYLDILKPWRDPEWGTVYDTTHQARFSRLLATDSVFGPGPAPALLERAHPDAVFATHVANVLHERPQVKSRVRERFIAELPNYADLSPAERLTWSAI